MKYRIWTNGRVFKLQRKKLIKWVWLDNCDAWCWYGKRHPMLYSSLDAAIDRIEAERKKEELLKNWKLITSGNVENYLEEDKDV